MKKLRWMKDPPTSRDAQILVALSKQLTSYAQWGKERRLLHARAERERERERER